MLLDAELQARMNQRMADKKSLPAGVTDAKKWEVAQQFEGMFTHEMVKAMRKTIPESEEDQSSSGREIFQGMLDEQYANMLSHNNNPRGISMSIYRELERQEGKEVKIPAEMRPTLKTDFAYPKFTSAPKSNPLDAIVKEASQTHQVDADLIRSVIQQESAGQKDAVSPVGAKGLMQLMDSTAKEVGVSNAFDPRQNVMGGTAYLKKLLNRFGGSEKLALAAYNAGPGNVEKFGGLPPFKETQNYVKSILSRRAQIESGKGI